MAKKLNTLTHGIYHPAELWEYPREKAEAYLSIFGWQKADDENGNIESRGVFEHETGLRLILIYQGEENRWVYDYGVFPFKRKPKRLPVNPGTPVWTD